MNEMLSQRERLERLWHDPDFVHRWGKERNRRLSDLRQRAFADGGQRWTPDPLEGLDHHESVWPEPIQPTSEQLFSNRPRRHRKRGDAEFVLPEPVLKDGKVEFPLAASAGASPQQLARAAALHQGGLTGKAQRAAHCGVLGQRRDCLSNRDHGFYIPYRCGNRYCPTCGRHCFAALFSKHIVLNGVAQRLVPEWPAKGRFPARVIAKIDFTVSNKGTMPEAEAVRQFNMNVRKFWRAVEREFGISRKDYGVVWCDEFGGNNTNLHAHGAYAGPWLPQKDKELSRIWSQIVGEQAFVSIKPAKSFPAALAHALKYTSKYVSDSTPERLAELEKAFNRVRRVHTLAAFYNVKQAEPGEEYGSLDCKGCPLCGGTLLRVSGWKMRPIPELKAAGLKNLEESWREAGRNNVFGSPRGSP